MVSLFAEIGSISFWPKTMDYNKALMKFITGRCNKAEIE